MTESIAFNIIDNIANTSLLRRFIKLMRQFIIAVVQVDQSSTYVEHKLNRE